MKVHWVGAFDASFSRNIRLSEWLRRSQVSLEVINVPLFNFDRSDVSAGSVLRVIALALIKYPILALRMVVREAPDLYLVSYPGWFDMPVVALVARLRRVPVVFDPFISLYETAIEDRNLYRRRSFFAKIARWIDRYSVVLADRVIGDTPPHLEYLLDETDGADHSSVLAVGADDAVFIRHTGPIDGTLVAFYGSLVPLHGIETILSAASILGSAGVRTVVVGAGQDSPKVARALQPGAMNYVEWRKPVPLDMLPTVVADAAVCLGIFGTSDKADRVVPHKVFEYLAMGKPVVTRDSAAIRSLFTEEEVKTVRPGDPEALAEAVRYLLSNSQKRNELGEAGHAAYLERFHGTIMAQRLEQILRETIESQGSRTRG